MTLQNIITKFQHALDDTIPTKDKKFIIADHQRNSNCWSLKNKKKLINSIKRNFPIPSILVGSIINETQQTLEDGLQRLMAILLFLTGQISDEDEKMFKDYSPMEQANFYTYQITVTEYGGATLDERIEIFHRFQLAVPLKLGELLHAHSITPLISYVKKTLMTPGMGLFDRATAVWGRRKDLRQDPRRTELVKAAAMVAGIIYGPDYVSKKDDSFFDKRILTREFDENLVTRDLERIFEIYEMVQERAIVNMTWLKKQFCPSMFNGYIIYSMHHLTVENRGEFKPHSMKDEDWNILRDQWVDFMFNLRIQSEQNSKNMDLYLKESLHASVGNTRSWTLARWRNGYLTVFEPEHLKEEVEEDDEDEDEDEDE